MWRWTRKRCGGGAWHASSRPLECWMVDVVASAGICLSRPLHQAWVFLKLKEKTSFHTGTPRSPPEGGALAHRARGSQ